MTFNEPVVLGRTGLKVGPLGIASGYKAPAIEEAFERGCNYFTWGTVIRGYVPTMREALLPDRAASGARPAERRARSRRCPHPGLLRQ